MAVLLDKMNNSSTQPPTKRLMPVLIGGAVLVLLGGGGVFLGLNSKLTTLQTTAQQQDAAVADSEQITRRYQTTLDEYNETQDRIKFLETAVSAKSYVPTLLQQIQALAGQTHLTVTSIRPEMVPPPPPPVRPADGSAPAADTKKAAPPPYDVVNVGIDVIGTYADTSTFLYSLTRFPKIIALSGVQMHPNAAPVVATPGTTAAPPVATVTTNLKLVAFMFHDDDAPAAAPAQTATSNPGEAGAPNSGLPYTTIPPASVGTISAAAGRAAVGAAAATRASNARSAAAVSSL